MILQHTKLQGGFFLGLRYYRDGAHFKAGTIQVQRIARSEGFVFGLQELRGDFW